MGFRTKIDLSDNRQAKQHIETFTVLSGGTKFGQPFELLPSGPNMNTTGETEAYSMVVSTFSGNSATTVYSWYDNRMQDAWSTLSAFTLSNSGVTQFTSSFGASSTSVIDGNTVALSYSGISYDLYVLSIIDLGGGSYSGTVESQDLFIYSAITTDFTGRTIWADVSGITRTDRLIVANNPTVGYVLTCSDSEGMVEWAPSSGTSGSTIWVLGSGSGSARLNGNLGAANGVNSVSEGILTQATGNYSHAEGSSSTASGIVSHAEGDTTTASGQASHAEGQLTTAGGANSHAEGRITFALGFSSHAEGDNTSATTAYAHAEGVNTLASGTASHAEGENTIASANNSHAGGSGSTASGLTSFVHGVGSIAGGNGAIVLGNGITGNSANTTYVDGLNIKTVGAGPGVTDLGVDANGFVVNQASDIRLKENISTLTNALNKVMNLRGVTYQWKDRNSGGDDFRIGFIAQEVNKIEPLLVTKIGEIDGDDLLGVNYKDVTPLLVEAIKELSSGATLNNTYLETQTILAEDNNIQLNFNGNKETAINGGLEVLHARGDGLSAELKIDVDGNWVSNNDLKPNGLVIPIYTPLSSNDETGNEGNITRDNDYLYIKTNSGWKRTNLENF